MINKDHNAAAFAMSKRGKFLSVILMLIVLEVMCHTIGLIFIREVKDFNFIDLEKIMSPFLILFSVLLSWLIDFKLMLNLPVRASSSMLSKYRKKRMTELQQEKKKMEYEKQAIISNEGEQIEMIKTQNQINVLSFEKKIRETERIIAELNEL